jgi:hypothetical protein
MGPCGGLLWGGGGGAVVVGVWGLQEIFEGPKKPWRTFVETCKSSEDPIVAQKSVQSRTRSKVSVSPDFGRERTLARYTLHGFPRSKGFG